MPNILLAKVLSPYVDAHCHEKAAIDMLLPDTPLAVLDAVEAFTLETASFALGPCLASFMARLGAGVAGGVDAEQTAQVIAVRTVA